jgi:phosphopantothenoylcysteine decarboxylase/phosphopantothenate--cysteine ligase
VSGPTSLPDPFGVTILRIETAAQMCEAVEHAYEGADAVIAAAAVADFRPAAPASGKLKKEAAPGVLALERTQDILASLGARKGTRVLIGFAAEAGEAATAARGKLVAKGLDLVVANDVTERGAGFEGPTNRVTLVSAAGDEALPCMDKRAVARIVLDRLADLLEGR